MAYSTASNSRAPMGGSQGSRIPDPPYVIHYLGIIQIPSEDATPVRVLSEASTLPGKAPPRNAGGGGLFSSLNSVAFGAADFLSGGTITQNIENLKTILVNEVTKKALKEKTANSSNKFTVETDDYIFHLYTPNKSLGAVMVSTTDPTKTAFPKDHAHSALMEVYNSFTSAFKGKTVTRLTDEECLQFKPSIEEYLNKLKSGTEMMQIRRNLDGTHNDVQQIITKLTIRGDKVDDMVGKSSLLNEQTKQFYSQSKKQNNCCVLM